MKMEQTMIERINEVIKMAVMSFEMTGKNDERLLSRIYGMIEMLEIATGKKYAFNENGVYEK